jgi:hypothetical protein
MEVDKHPIDDILGIFIKRFRLSGFPRRALRSASTVFFHLAHIESGNTLYSLLPPQSVSAFEIGSTGVPALEAGDFPLDPETNAAGSPRNSVDPAQNQKIM